MHAAAVSPVALPFSSRYGGILKTLRTSSTIRPVAATEARATSSPPGSWASFRSCDRSPAAVNAIISSTGSAATIAVPFQYRQRSDSWSGNGPNVPRSPAMEGAVVAGAARREAGGRDCGFRGFFFVREDMQSGPGVMNANRHGKAYQIPRKGKRKTP